MVGDAEFMPPNYGCTTCLVRTVSADVVAILIGKYTSLVTKYKSADIGLRLSAHQYHLRQSVIYNKNSHLESVEKASKELSVKRTEQHSSNAGSIAAAHKTYCVP